MPTRESGRMKHLFFHWSAAHRDLHSFPTRRSSDLGWSKKDTRSTIPTMAATVYSWPGAATNRPRSEEHTSELQSQSNLVCRLLLEKKHRSGHPPPLAVRVRRH